MLPAIILGVVFVIAAAVLVRGIVLAKPAVVTDAFAIFLFGVAVFFGDFLYELGHLFLSIVAFVGMSLVAGTVVLVRIVVAQEDKVLKSQPSIPSYLGGKAPSLRLPSFEWLIRWVTPKPRRKQISRVETRYLTMKLDINSGSLSGRILRGPLRGKPLKALSFDEGLSLQRECERADQQSAQLLETWLRRTFPDAWEKEQAAAARASARSGNGALAESMSFDEACLILDVTPDASTRAVKEAHHRLMQRVHPDHGGSTYLAAKINQARDRLLQ